MKGFSITVAEKGRMCCAAIVATLSIVLAFGFAAPMQANADEGAAGLAAGGMQITTQQEGQEDVSMYNPEWASLWANDSEGYSAGYFLVNVTNELEVTKVTSSDSNVLKVKHNGSEYKAWNWMITTSNAGSARLSITFKQDGVEKTISETYTVKTFPNAIKSIKFNGTALSYPTSKNYISQAYLYEFKGTSGKLEVSLASGWRIGSFSASIMDKDYKTLSEPEISNGKAFSVAKNANHVSIHFSIYNDSGENVYFSVYVYRNKPLEMPSKTVCYIGYPKTIGLSFSRIYGALDDIKVTSVKSSKPGVVAVKMNKNLMNVKVQAKKAGTAKITIKYTFKGRSYTATANYVASKDYPIKSAVVNGKSVKLKKNPCGYVVNNYKKNTGTAKVVAAKGWKVKSVKYYSDANDYFNQGKGKTVKNGAKVKTVKGKQGIVVVTLKKGKTSFVYRVYFNRV